MRVGDVMTPHPFTVPWNASIVDAREVMSRRRIRHLLVTDDGGLPAGVVTDRDIRSSLPSPATSLSVWEINDRLERLTVGQVMTEALMTIGPDHDAGAAARMMIDHRIGALPVREGQKLVGIVTHTDLLRALATDAGDRALAG